MGGRPAAKGPTAAEQQLIDVVADYQRAHGDEGVTAAEIARLAGWTRQRAHALVQRCHRKRLISRARGVIKVRA